MKCELQTSHAQKPTENDIKLIIMRFKRQIFVHYSNHCAGLLSISELVALYLKYSLQK